MAKASILYVSHARTAPRGAKVTETKNRTNYPLIQVRVPCGVWAFGAELFRNGKYLGTRKTPQ